MILDALITAFALILEPLLMAFVYLFAGIANLFLVIIELIIGIFIQGFTLKRVPKKNRKRKSGGNSEENEERPVNAPVWPALVLIAVITLLVLILAFKDKEIHFIATDGKSLPFAEIIITTDKGSTDKRTDIDGKIKVPRFGLVSLKIDDPRYKEQVWSKEEIENELIVKRSLLGSGLDKIYDMLDKDKK